MKYAMKTLLALMLVLALTLPVFAAAVEESEGEPDALVILEAGEEPGGGTDESADEVAGPVAFDVEEADGGQEDAAGDPQPAIAGDVATVYFITEDYLLIDTAEVRVGDEIACPADPQAPEGMAFEGWYDADGNRLFADGAPEVARLEDGATEINVFARFVDAPAPEEPSPLGEGGALAPDEVVPPTVPDDETKQETTSPDTADAVSPSPKGEGSEDGDVADEETPDEGSSSAPSEPSPLGEGAEQGEADEVVPPTSPEEGDLLPTDELTDDELAALDDPDADLSVEEDEAPDTGRTGAGTPEAGESDEAGEIETEVGEEEEAPDAERTNEDTHTHDGITFEPWTATDSLPDSRGDYYLTADVTLAEGWVAPEFRINLCLNGHSITSSSSAADNYVIKITSGTTLNLYDEDGDLGRITHADNAHGTGVRVDDNGSFKMHGGTITGNDGGGVLVQGTFNMDGGAITGNDADSGGGVSVGFTGEFNMSGGTISENSAGLAGGVIVGNGGQFTMTDGAITGNAATDDKNGDGGGVYVIGTFDMSGGTISDNDAKTDGGGVIVMEGTLNISGTAVIADNAAGNLGGGVYLYNCNVATMSGGRISGNTADGGGGVFMFGSSFTMSGGKISGNASEDGGGGVYAESSSAGNCTFTMTGGRISGNAITGDGIGRYTVYARGNTNSITTINSNEKADGVYASQNVAIKVSGSPVVAGNAVYLETGKKIEVTGTLTSTVPIPVKTPMTNPPVVITSGLKGKGSASNFISAVSGYTVSLVGSGETEGEAQLEAKETHAVKINATPNGAVYADFLYASSGTSVTLTLEPNEGCEYVQSSLKVLTTDGEAVTVTPDPPSGKPLTCEFTMPDGDVTVSAEFISEWGKLQKAIDGAENGETVKVDKSVTATADDVALVVDGKDIILDLNGYTLDRGLGLKTKKARDEGYVIIVKEGGSLTVQGGGKITGGKTKGYGGGVYVDDTGTFTLNGGTITGNKSTNNNCGGGGVYVSGNGTFTMNGGTITGNQSTNDNNGGGVYVDGTFTLSNGEITGNTAMKDGGGVYVDDGGKFTLSSGGEITGNTAMNDGGGVCVNDGGEFTLSSGGNIENNQATSGGGVYTDDTFTMTGGTITGNTAIANDGGGGVYVGDEDSAFTMSGGTITGNTAKNGGGVYVEDGGFTLSGGSVTNNTAEDGDGGGVYVEDGKLEMKKEDGKAAPEITGNRAKKVYSTAAGQGGGVFVHDDGQFILSGGKIENNRATQGGGVCTTGTSTTGTSPFTMSGGSITGNQATQGGGGLFVKELAGATLSGDASISQNTANDCGGGVYLLGNLTLSESATIAGNTVICAGSNDNGFGGGVFVEDSGIFTMSGGSISGNGAAGDNKGNGGGVFVEGEFDQSGGKIIGNFATVFGGGVYLYNGNSEMYKVSGAAVVKDNKAGCTYGSGGFTGGNENNVYLVDETVITVQDKLTGGHESIGVTTETPPTAAGETTPATLVVFTSGMGGTQNRLHSAFFSDKKDFGVCWNDTSKTEAALGVAVQCSAAGFEGTYDGNSHSITVTCVPTSAKTYYTEDADTWNDGIGPDEATQGTWKTDLSFNNAGEYTVYYWVTCDGYADSKGKATVKITPIDATVTITGATDKTNYDGQAHTVKGYTAKATYLYDVKKDFTFTGTAEATRTDAGTTKMGLAADQFTNNNKNFKKVTFNVTDGGQTINPIDATVTITGATDTTNYDGQAHTVKGYTAKADTDLYDVKKYFTFSGRAVATQRDAGTANMGLTAGQFTNNNKNFKKVTFNVTDGWQTIDPIDATVTITGATDTADYDGQAHTVKGYVAQASTDLYDVDSDFTFSGRAVATQRDAGTANMGLAAGQFTNNNKNFKKVTFNVTDGWQTIDPIDATVTITGATDTADYDGQAHTVKGYVAQASTDLYDVDNDFIFSGKAVATQTDAGKANMGLAADQFKNINGNYKTVTFEVTDGWQTVNPIDATVTIIGATGTATYDGQAHTATGYAAQASTTLYDVKKDFTFSGTASVTRRDAGKANMGLAADQFANANGNFKTVTFKVTDGWQKIVPAALTVAAKDASKTYGDGDPELTFDVDGLVEGDSLTGALTRAAGEDVGSYAIRQGTLKASGNYDMTFTGATLTIERKALAVAARDASKIYGEPDPQWTCDAPGLVGKDRLTGRMTREAGENVGTYAIRQGTLKASDNYDMTFAGATLTIQQKHLTAPTIELSQSEYTADGKAKKPKVTVKDGDTVVPATEYTVSYADNVKPGLATVTLADVEGGNYVVSGSTTFIIAPATSTRFFAKLKAKGKTSLVVSWDKVKGAKGYDVFFSPCNDDEEKYTPKLIMSVKGNKTFSYTKTGLKKGETYKAFVMAYKWAQGRKVYIELSPTVHAYVHGRNDYHSNASRIVLTSKSKVTLKVGKTSKIRASVKVRYTGRHLITHAARLRYYSSNPKVAKVTAKGKIVAVKKGKCTITLLTPDGVKKTVKVTVK